MHKVCDTHHQEIQMDNNVVHFALLQIRSVPVGTGLPSLTMMLFNRPIRAVLLQMGRKPIIINYDDEYYEALKSRQETYTKNNDTWKDFIFFLKDLQ